MMNKQYFAFSRPINSYFRFGDQLHIVWKDIDSTFLGCSDFLEEETGLTVPNIIGKNDRDLIWGDRASQYRKDEEAVLNLKSTRCIYEPAKTTQGEVSLLTFKTPMISASGLTEGVFQVSFTLEQKSLLEITQLINQLGVFNLSCRLFPLPNQEIAQKLTKREMECLFHMTYGKSSKEIARLFMCSPRTIESHIEHIKTKLHCYTRSQMVDKVMQQRY